jgi:hypothetical protein
MCEYYRGIINLPDEDTNSKNTILLVAALAFTILCNSLDLLATLFFLQFPYFKELNPFMNYLLMNYDLWVFVTTKIASIVFAVFVSMLAFYKLKEKTFMFYLYFIGFINSVLLLYWFKLLLFEMIYKYA